MNATDLELGLLGDVGTLAWARRGDGLLTDSGRRRYIAAAVAESARLMPRLLALKFGKAVEPGWGGDLRTEFGSSLSRLLRRGLGQPLCFATTSSIFLPLAACLRIVACGSSVVADDCPGREETVQVTSLNIVCNVLDVPIEFVNTENSGNDREVASGFCADVGNCWIPWCSSAAEFADHHIEIVLLPYDPHRPPWRYMWQQDEFVKDNRQYPALIVTSRTGYVRPQDVYWVETDSGAGEPLTGYQYELDVGAPQAMHTGLYLKGGALH